MDASHHEEVITKTDKLINLNRAEMIVSCIGGVVALLAVVGSFYILPYRLTQVEARVTLIETQRQQDHDLLIEIRTNIKQLLDKQDSHK